MMASYNAFEESLTINRFSCQGSQDMQLEFARMHLEFARVHTKKLGINLPVL